VAGLVGAIIGAVIGGIASIEGAILIERWMLTRTTRVRLYDELLPGVLKTSKAVPTSPEEEGAAPLDNLEAQARELYRAATIAGMTDQEHVKRIQSSIGLMQHNYRQYRAVRAEKPTRTVIEQVIEGDPLARLPPMKTTWQGPHGEQTAREATLAELEEDRRRVEMETQGYTQQLNKYRADFEAAHSALSSQTSAFDNYLEHSITAHNYPSTIRFVTSRVRRSFEGTAATEKADHRRRADPRTTRPPSSSPPGGISAPATSRPGRRGWLPRRPPGPGSSGGSPGRS
jgi:hypothetical protein